MPRSPSVWRFRTQGNPSGIAGGLCCFSAQEAAAAGLVHALDHSVVRARAASKAFALAFALAAACVTSVHAQSDGDTQTVEITGSRWSPSVDFPVGGLWAPGIRWDPFGRSTPAETQLAATPPENNTDKEQCTTDNPVVLSTGEKFIDESDFTAQGLYALSLKRTYRSAAAGSLPFGPNWYAGLAYPRVAFLPPMIPWKNGYVPSAVNFTEPDGTLVRYNVGTVSSEASMVSYSSSNAAKLGTFQRTITSWILYRPNTKYVVSTTGLVQRIMNNTGVNLLTYTYDANSQLTRVTTLVGQFVAFTWQSGRIVGAVDTGGNAWAYGYNTNDMLATVTSPGANPDIRTYHYEVAGQPTLLTGISINGQRFTTYSYYADKRVSESRREGGEVRETFAYRATETDVTTATGQTTTYRFQQVGSSLVPIGQTRAPTASCPTATAQTTYDANGYIDNTVDWNGSTTDYAYSSIGQLLQVTSAAGTSAALTRVNNWNSSQLLETLFKDSSGVAFSKIIYTYPSGAGNPAMGMLASETWVDLRTGAQRALSYAYTFHPNSALASAAVTQALPGDATSITTTSYDPLGNKVGLTNSLGHQQSWSSFNGLGLPGRMTDANGVITDYVYDAKGNKTAQTLYHPSGSRVTTFAYNNNRQVTDIAYPTGRVDRSRYNAATRLNQQGNALGEYVSFDFDVAANTWRTRSNRNAPGWNGSVPTASAAGEFLVATQMDSLGRIRAQMGNNGQQAVFSYDNNGNVTDRHIPATLESA